MEIKCIRHTS